MQPLLYRYGYDQLNRLVSKNAYNGLNTNNRWTPILLNDYKEAFSYDANGNILTALRNATTAGGNTLAMDALTYHYQANTNKLIYVTDTVVAATQNNDIDNQSAGNYSYDKIGNLISDNAENLQSINWTVYGKIKSITKPASAIYYSYDAAGNRVHKKITGTNANEEIYVRDAQGNILAVYRLQSDSTFWKEQHLYGSSRLGIYQYNGIIPVAPVVTNGTVTTLPDSLLMGNTSYELSNHLGNVLAVINDKKIGVSSLADSSLTDHYVADVLSLQDYYAGGMFIGERSYNNVKYAYGFNGKRKDNEILGEGNAYDFDARIYDPRTVTWYSTDPLQKKYPNESPYNFVSRNPILYMDNDGRDKVVTITIIGKDGGRTQLRRIDEQYFKYKANTTTTNAWDNMIEYKRASVYVDIVIDLANPKNNSYNENVGTFYHISAWEYSKMSDAAKWINNKIFGSGDQSSKIQYGYKLYGNGHDMDWEKGLPRAADGSESLDIKGWLDFTGGLRDGADFSDLLKEGKLKRIVSMAEKIEDAVSKTIDAFDGVLTGENSGKIEPVTIKLPMKKGNWNNNQITVEERNTKKATNQKDPDTVFVQKYTVPKRKQ